MHLTFVIQRYGYGVLGRSGQLFAVAGRIRADLLNRARRSSYKCSYDYGLVALSVIIAMLAAYSALHLAGRITVARGGHRLICWPAEPQQWHLVDALHRDELAFILPVPVRYHVPS